MKRERLGQHFLADEAYRMIRGPNKNINPNMFTVITTASTDRVNEYLGLHRVIDPTQIRLRRKAMDRFIRETDPEVMDEQRVNINRKRTPINAYVPTSPQTPRSKSSGSVQIVEGPKPEVIDLSIDEIEAMIINDVT
jgi:hypothetical protein